MFHYKVKGIGSKNLLSFFFFKNIRAWERSHENCSVAQTRVSFKCCTYNKRLKTVQKGSLRIFWRLKVMRVSSQTFMIMNCRLPLFWGSHGNLGSKTVVLKFRVFFHSQGVVLPQNFLLMRWHHETWIFAYTWNITLKVPKKSMVTLKVCFYKLFANSATQWVFLFRKIILNITKLCQIFHFSLS